MLRILLEDLATCASRLIPDYLETTMPLVSRQAFHMCRTRNLLCKLYTKDCVQSLLSRTEYCIQYGGLVYLYVEGGVLRRRGGVKCRPILRWVALLFNAKKEQVSVMLILKRIVSGQRSNNVCALNIRKTFLFLSSLYGTLTFHKHRKAISFGPATKTTDTFKC
jgi:hypothetical protein